MMEDMDWDDDVFDYTALNRAASAAMRALPVVQAERDAARAESARYRAALEFYADDDNWRRSEECWGWFHHDADEGPLRARAALKADGDTSATPS